LPAFYPIASSVDLTLAEASGFDLLIVPGGWGTRAEVERPAFLELLSARAEEAKIVASVCTGSALLAKAGILDGKKATSNKLADGKEL
jgi:putative intracellular protease/amidase